MWQTIADIALLSFSAFSLWDMAGLSTAIRGAASRITRKKVTSVAVIDNSAAIGFIASLVCAIAQGELCPLTVAAAAALAAINRLAVRRIERNANK